MADVTTENETLLQRLAKFVTGAAKRAAVRQSIDELAGIARLQPTQGKLEALIDLRDSMEKRFGKFGTWAGMAAMVGIGLAAVALPSVIAATAIMGNEVSSFGLLDAMWTVGKPAFQALGILVAASGASAIAAAIVSKPERSIKRLIANEAEKTVKAKPETATGLSPRYAQRLKVLFTYAAPRPAKYDKTLAEKTAVKNAEAQSYWKEKAAEQKL